MLQNYWKPADSVGAFTDVVLNTQGEPLNYTNFEVAEPTWRCAAFQVPPYQDHWTSVSCKTYRFCVSCLEREPVVVKMRGLCDQGRDDVLFRVEQREGHMPELR